MADYLRQQAHGKGRTTSARPLNDWTTIDVPMGQLAVVVVVVVVVATANRVGPKVGTVQVAEVAAQDRSIGELRVREALADPAQVANAPPLLPRTPRTTAGCRQGRISTSPQLRTLFRVRGRPRHHGCLFAASLLLFDFPSPPFSSSSIISTNLLIVLTPCSALACNYVLLFKMYKNY